MGEGERCWEQFIKDQGGVCATLLRVVVESLCGLEGRMEK